jgi:serine/threonine protein kinase/beta-lactam-binding protein with PASTA domain
MTNLSGQLIANRYQVISLVASGGMASVYLANDQVLERKVALKVIHPHLAKDKSFVEKFQREAKMAAQLSHPNLVNVFDQGTDGDVIFLVMEYVPGITLRDAMNDFGSLDTKKALEIIEPLTEALAAAHSAGILHRDLKPENVFLSDGGKVKLGDFGLAREISEHTQTGSVVGTVAYLSPELVLRGQADARSDVYSLGVMIFEMLTGKQPYQGEQAVQVAYQHANENIPAPSTLNPSVPELLDEIVLWTTARNPSQRPASAVALLPVITRAKHDLSRGLTTTLSEIDKTARISLDEDFVSPIGATEVLDVSEIESFAATSSLANKLEKSNKRSKLWLVIFTVIALIGGAGSGWWFSSGPGGLAAVPDLTGRSLEAAVQALDPLGVVIEQLEENSGTVAEGFITRTEPAAGYRVFKDSVVKVFISLGPKQLAVPEAKGLSIEATKKLLTDSGFVVGSVKNYFGTEAAGQVIGLSAPTGTILNQGSVLDVLVSIGAVPDVLGLSAEAARALLAELPITIEEVEVFNNQIPAGQAVGLVLSEDPLPENGSAVLEISKGPEIVIMPNTVGETIAAAKALLENLGLLVVVDTNQLSSNFGIAKVKRQSPEAGSEARVGESVTIISR